MDPNKQTNKQTQHGQKQNFQNPKQSDKVQKTQQTKFRASTS